MSPEELAREVKRLEIVSRHAVTEVFAGEYSSAFKGRGIEFADVREYQPGDDVRTIDWNVTARSAPPRPFVKRFIEERELTIVLAVDVSASGLFGSGDRPKRRLAAEVCGTLAFAALRKNDKVGLLAFTDRVERFLPPRKGPRHTLRLVREVLAIEPAGSGTDLTSAADHLLRVLPRRAVVFFVSDFMAPDIRTPLRRLAAKHEVIAVEVSDPRESEIPRGVSGLIELRDAETGRTLLLDASSRRVRREYAQAAAQRRARLDDELLRSGADRLSVSTDRPYLHDLVEFFRRRERRRAR